MHAFISAFVLSIIYIALMLNFTSLHSILTLRLYLSQPDRYTLTPERSNCFAYCSPSDANRKPMECSPYDVHDISSHKLSKSHYYSARVRGIEGISPLICQGR
eukprot:268674_1